MTQKTELRVYFRSICGQISKQRRVKAAEDLLEQLRLRRFSYILSFFSVGLEIDLSLVNQEFASENRLILPKISGRALELYSVKDLKTELIPSLYGLMEPNPSCCKQAVPDLVLVPGLAFDEEGFRLGYGKGFYDRLLPEIPLARTIGVGFKEQKSERLLPKDPWDVPVDELLLF